MTFADPGALAVARRRRRSKAKAPSASASYRRFVVILFGVVVLLSVTTQAWAIAGAPVRALAAVGLLGMLILNNGAEAARAFRKHRNLLLLTLGVGLLGFFISLANHMKIDALLREVVEIHVQTAINLVLGAIVAEVCGASAIVSVVVFATLLSTAFAVAQFLGVEAAWSVRDGLARFTNEAVKYTRERPNGLSLSVITLGTQLCLALAAVVIQQHRVNRLRGARKRIDPMVVAATVIFIIGSLAAGNRSPVIGVLIFFAVYTFHNRPRLLLVVLPGALLAIPIVDSVLGALQGTGLRIFETGDKSSEGRTTLAYYGFRLFLAQPVGYGLGFDPRRYWSDHWQYVIDFPNPSVIKLEELHNYILNMLNYYGVGILAAVPVAIALMRKHAALLIAFLPYCVHIAFHNYGPYQNDTFIMLVIASAVGPIYLKASKHSRRRRSAGSRSRGVQTSRTPSADAEVRAVNTPRGHKAAKTTSNPAPPPLPPRHDKAERSLSTAARNEQS